MSKSVKYCLVAVALILVLWMLVNSAQNQDLFSHVRAKSNDIIKKVDDTRAEELDKQLVTLTQEAKEDNTGKKIVNWCALRKVRDKVIHQRSGGL